MKKNPELRIRSCFLVIVMSLLMTAGCEQQEKSAPDGASSGNPVVVCANYPLKYFAERIGGELVQINLLVPAGQDPAFWEPSPEDISEMQQADLVLLNGAGYEKWLPHVTLPEGKMVDTAAGFPEELIKEEGGVAHQHGPEGEHTHAEVAFTTWLDFSLASKQAQAVEEALRGVLPDQTDQLRAGLLSLTHDLMGLDAELKSWGESLQGRPVVASHPVYQYFARRYGLNLKSVHWEPDVIPNESGWRELQALLREHRARIMIWEEEPASETANRLNQMQIDRVLFRPCSNAPKQGDFLAVMRTQTAMLKPNPSR